MEQQRSHHAQIQGVRVALIGDTGSDDVLVANDFGLRLKVINKLISVRKARELRKNVNDQTTTVV